MIRFVLAAMLAASPIAASAQPAPPAAVAAKDDLVRIVLDTSLGRIVLALDQGRAPVTTANFLRYVEGDRFDGQTFYRAMKMGGGGLIQGGVRSDARKLFPPIAHESTSETGLKNVAGAIVMANAGPGTARSDFFILLSDQPAFDAGHPQGGHRLRSLRSGGRGHGRGEKDIRGARLPNQGRRRAAGSDARARDRDRQGRAAIAKPYAGRMPRPHPRPARREA